MGKRRHSLPAALIAALLTATSAGAATPDTPANPLRFFADCAGRLSAELSHRWMMSDPSADQIERLRADLLLVLAALTPDGEGRGVLNWRLQARSAHSALLSRAAFSNDSWASDRAAAEVAYCAALILPPGTPAPPPAHTTPIAATEASAPLP